MDSPPTTPPTPLVADLRLEKFLRLRAAHRKQLKVSADVWRYLDAARHSHELTELVGPTGVGKTNLVETIEQEAATKFATAGAPVGRLPVLRVNAAPPQNDTFRFPSLYRAILDAADDYFNQRARLGRLRTSDELQTAAINVLRNRAPLVFVIDEAQHITYAVRAERLQQHLDNLKWLADQIPCPVLLVGSRELLRFSLISAQLARRVNQVPFLPYRPVRHDLSAFLGVTQSLIDAMPLTTTFDLKKHHSLFFDGAAGSVGLLKQWFNRVVENAIRSDATSATLDDFEKHRLPLGKLTLIAEEYGKMQHELALVNGTHAALRVALGYPAATATPPATPVPVITDSEEPASSDAPVTSAHAPLPGERTLGRDPVGTAA